MSQNFLTNSRHGTKFYFRRRVPDDLRQLIGHSYLVKSLRTGDRREAIILARALAAQTDRIFVNLRNMTTKDRDSISLDYVFELELDDSGRPKKLTVDAQPHEQEAVASAIQVALSNLPSSDRRPITDTGPTVSEAIKDYLEKADLKATTKKTYVSRLDFAQEHFGAGVRVLTIGQAEFSKYADFVVANIENVTTQGLFITTCCGFLNWHRVRAGAPLLTTKTLIPAKKTPDTEDRDGFSLSQLEVLFENVRRFRERQPHKYWATLAIAFLGCRLEELAQANLNTDLHFDEEANVWYLQLDELPDGDGEVRKSVKKTSSWRRVPIHSALIAHGFVEYLRSERAAGMSRPFERHCPPYRSRDGQLLKWSHYLGNWGGRELQKLMRENKLPRGSLTYFHSMRHTFKTLLGNAGVSSEISEALSGRRYGGADAERYEKLKKNHRRLSNEGIEPGLQALAAILPPSNA